MIATEGRDGRILSRFRSGDAPQDIADSEGISRQRFYVILKREARAIGKRVASLRPRPEKPAEHHERPPGKALREAAKLLGMEPQSLKQLAWKGRVPHAVLHGQWYFPAQSLAFVRKYPKARGALGQKIASEMKLAAARLDPACLARQREYDAAHPPGSWPKGGGAGRQLLRRRDAPKNLRELWSRTAGADRLLRLSQLCGMLSEAHGGGWFLLPVTDVARISGAGRDEAARLVGALEELGRLQRKGWRLKWRG